MAQDVRSAGEDHAKALYLILKNGLPGETYNVGGRNERTNLQVVRGICSALDELSLVRKAERTIDTLFM